MSDLFPRPRRNPASRSRNGGRAPVESVPLSPEAAGFTPAPARVGLKPPKNGWKMRHYVTEVLIPSLFRRREGMARPADLSPLRVDAIGVTWIGHASFLLRIGGLNLLVDPVWSLWLKGIKRLRRPGLRLRDLPHIDAVLITHAHFDHLDKRTLRAVAANQPVIVPYGVGTLVRDLGFRRVHELPHWGSVDLGGVRVTLTPAQHWGARLLADFHRGFGGYVIAHGERSVFHCGDTAWFDGFEEIGRRLPVEIALLPIGAYAAPTGREVHMNPEEAVRAFRDLRARWLVPMHWGSFRLGLEPMEEPLARLRSAAATAGLESRLAVLEEGMARVF